MAEKEKKKIHWHPGFYSATELELRENKHQLEFLREYNLSKEPLRIDLFIIKKLTEEPIINEIGRLFRRYNVVEYKSPEDGLTIDDYYKTVGYACLYKGLSEAVDVVPSREITVTLVRESYPRGLFAALQAEGAAIEERFPGIYYLSGHVQFETQIIVTSLLSPESHVSLRVLSRTLQEEDARRFIEMSYQMQEPGDRLNVDAVLQVSVSANHGIYGEIRGDHRMCQALRDLMKDDYDRMKNEFERELAHNKEICMAEGRAQGMAQGMAEGRAQGMAQGMEQGMAQGVVQGRAQTLAQAVFGLMKNAGFPLEQALRVMNVSEAERPMVLADVQALT